LGNKWEIVGEDISGFWRYITGFVEVGMIIN
jgi:hypothetical protein